MTHHVSTRQDPAEGSRQENPQLIGEGLPVDPFVSLQKVLPALIRGYCSLVASPPPNDHKGIAAFHSACRANLAHVDTLMRLLRESRKAFEGQASAGEDNSPDELVAEAQAILEQFSEYEE